MRKIIQNKKAVSLLVSYVILISIVLAMSSLVYAWIKARADKPFAEESCPKDLSLILVSSPCSVSGYTNTMNITVQNKGLFNIHGYIIKSSKDAEGMAGKSSFELCEKDEDGCANIIEFPEVLKANEKNSNLFDYKEDIMQIEIEPFIKKEGDNVYCEKSIITAKPKCSLVP